MKTAVLISGHMRSFERCLPTLHWHVFRHFAGGDGTVDFYVSTEPDADAPKAKLLREKYPTSRVEIDLTPQPDPICSPLDALIYDRKKEHAPYAISVPFRAVLGQLWRLQRCWYWFTARREWDYELVCRCRPDIWFEHAANLVAPLDPAMARTPWWGRFGGVNDRFALLGHAAAPAYFSTWLRLSSLLEAGCPLHPESLIKASLEAGGCGIDDTLDVSFSTLRANGERRFPEIMAQDIAHFAPR